MSEEIEKIILNNCGMQDGAILTEYITNLQQRIDKAIEYLEKERKSRYEGIIPSYQLIEDDLLKILGDKEND